jgi:hypothetical protein
MARSWRGLCPAVVCSGLMMMINLLRFRYNPAYLVTVEEKSDSFISIMTSNVLNPIEQLLREIINNEEFIHVSMLCQHQGVFGPKP